MALVGLVLAVALGALAPLADAAWPGPPAAAARAPAILGPSPQPCAAGIVPGVGLYEATGTAGPGCLVQGVDGFTISPKVIHVGQNLTATVTPKSSADRWGWSCLGPILCFVQQLGGHIVSGCANQNPTCTVKVTSAGTEPRWEVYVFGVDVPVVGGGTGVSVTSDYFIVGNNLTQLSGTVDFSPGPGLPTKPAAGIVVSAHGPHGSGSATTNTAGAYRIVLPKGTYTASAADPTAQPTSRTVTLIGNVGGVDFTTGCSGTPTFTLTHKRVGRETIIDLTGTNWDVAGCGQVNVTAAGVQGAVPIHVFDQSDFSFRVSVDGRLCGIDLFAEQSSGRKLQASFTLGGFSKAVVVSADPGRTPSGEQLFPGDRLCKSELGAEAAAVDAGQLTPAIVSAAAGTLGQTLLDLENAGNRKTILADPSGKVAVLGVSAAHLPLANFGAALKPITGVTPTAVASVPGDLSTQGFAISNGPLSVGGNLILQTGILVVKGDLTVTGSIQGSGTVYVLGNVTAAGASFSTTDQNALCASGSFNLPP